MTVVRVVQVWTVLTGVTEVTEVQVWTVLTGVTVVRALIGVTRGTIVKIGTEVTQHIFGTLRYDSDHSFISDSGIYSDKTEIIKTSDISDSSSSPA